MMNIKDLCKSKIDLKTEGQGCQWTSTHIVEATIILNRPTQCPNAMCFVVIEVSIESTWMNYYDRGQNITS